MTPRIFVELPPIVLCPRCQYSLRGHAGSGRCPECGENYESTDCVVHGAEGRTFLSHLISAVILSVGILLLSFYVGANMAMFLAFTLLALALGRRWILKPGIAGRTVIRRDGLVFYPDSRNKRSILWRHVSNIRLLGSRWRGWGLVMTVGEDHSVYVVPCGRDTEKCAILFESAREMWTQTENVSKTAE